MNIGHRVLVVTDDDAFRLRARRLLLDAGCLVSAASVAECPYEILFTAAPFAAVVVDPRSAGSEELRARLRRDPRSSTVPAVRAPRTLVAASEEAVYSALVGALFVEAVLAACRAHRPGSSPASIDAQEIRT